MKEVIKPKKKMEVSWYVKLNIMVMAFLCILFLMKKLGTSSFQAGLNNIFSTPQPERLIRIKSGPKKNKSIPNK